MAEPKRILIVEDNPADVWAIKAALAELAVPTTVEVLSDGEQALNFIDETRHIIDCLVLDLNLSKASGRQIIAKWRNSSYSNVPVVVVTSSDASSDREAIGQYTPFYFQKPMDFDHYMRVGGLISEALETWR